MTRTRAELAIWVVAGTALMVAGMLLTSCSVAGEVGKPTSPAMEPGVVILDTSSFWRCHVARASERVTKESGELVYIDDLPGRTHKKVGPRGKTKLVLNEIPGVVRSLPSADGWEETDFDDSAWVRCPGPFGQPLGNREYRPMERLCLRGRFLVTDPASLGSLQLSLAIQGGAIVYINGMELARIGLPEGKITPETPAFDYPKEAYLAPNGDLLRNRRDLEKLGDRFQKRIRKLAATVPPALLRKGTNVLAVEVHRAPAPEFMFFGKAHNVHPRASCWWIRLAVESVKLVSPTGKGAVPNTGRPKGLQVWNHPVVQKLLPTDYCEPAVPLRPVEIFGARNGAFAGQLVVSSTAAIRRLKVTVSSLRCKEGGTIPASAVEIYYPRPDGAPLERYGLPTFDGLAEGPPAEVPFNVEGQGSVQPVWVTVNVPGDARPGDYKGMLTIRVKGEKPVIVPLSLKVIDWLIPDPENFITHVGIVQSPESLALQYGVEMWSESHWKLIEKSFQHLAKVSNDVLYIPLVRRTHFGNEHSMVRWIRNSEGSYTYDFTIADRYLDTAVKQLGKLPVVVMYCWEPSGSQGHFGHLQPGDREILISVLDEKTGALEEATGPKWGTAECREFWKPVFEHMRQLLSQYGLADSMMVGIAGDMRPTKEAAGDLKAVAPEAPWVVHCHSYTKDIYGEPVGYLASIWGVGGIAFPAGGQYDGPFYGWRSPVRVVLFPRYGCGIYGRGIHNDSRLNLYRGAAEGPLICRGRGEGARGFGRIGADFWPVLKDRQGRNAGTLAGRYLESPWGQLRLNYNVHYLLTPGEQGPLSTIRLEMMREGLQEMEAKVLIEKALLDEAKRAKLGEELVGRCEKHLVERIRHWIRNLQHGKSESDWRWYISSGWQQRSAELYALAAEVAEVLEASDSQATK